jgi:predicted Zn finger-like uncharacterized protein
MPIQTTCPHCGTGYRLADQIRGKRVRCKRCNHLFLVEDTSAAESEDLPEAVAVGEEPDPREQIQPGLRRPAPPPGAAGDEPPRRPRQRRDQGNEAPGRRPRRQRSPVLIIALVSGGIVLALLLAVGAGAVLWSGWLRDLGSGLDAGFGPWPDVPPLAGPQGAYPADQVVTLHISGVSDQNKSEVIQDKLRGLVDPGGGYTEASAGSGQRLTVLLAPVRDPNALARKIDFGTVRGVSGRLITIVADKVEAAPANADAVTKALFDLKAGDSFRRADAARRLKDMLPDERRGEVARALGALLNDPNDFTRDNVIEALGVWGSKENVPALLQALNDERTRSAAIRALGQLKDERAVEPLAERLTNFFDRHEASEALKAIGPTAEPALIKRLHHHDEDVRREACQILKVIGTRQSIPELEKVAAEKDFLLTRAAEEAIRAITARQ